jgi:multidrug efflux system outer membrane protein
VRREDNQRRSRVRMPGLLAAFALTLVFAGCSVGPNYQRPNLAVPSAFRGAAEAFSTNSVADLPWWEIFKDEQLKNLIHTSLTNNFDVRIAAARIEQSRAVLAENRGLYFPQIGYQGEIGRGKNASGSSFANTGGKTSDFIAGGANASWEIDLWGRIRRLNEAARAQFFASREARHDVMISVLADVAQGYFHLLSLDRQLAIARESTNSFGESYRIFNARLQQGIVSKLETAAAGAALFAAAATVPDLERQVITQENRLNILLGRNPGPIPRSTNFSAEVFVPIAPAGLPSDLLRRRPDIRQAEFALRAANAQVGVATADLFPHFSLSGLLGQTSPELSAFTSGGAMAWSAAASLTGPIFQGGRLVAEVRRARAFREEARLQYLSVINTAFAEVSNALAAREKYAESAAQQALAVKNYQIAVQVSMDRYVAGKASYYEVLQEQQQLFPAENTLAQFQLNQFQAMVQLYRTLGGGWENAEAKVRAPNTGP